MSKKGLTVISTVIVAALIVFVGILDVFTHGFYSNAADVTQIPEEEKSSTVIVTDNDSSFSFIPQAKYFVGFDLYFVNVTSHEGAITMVVSDSDGIIQDQIEIDLSRVSNNDWYKVKTNKELKKGELYTVKFVSSLESGKLPSFLKVSEDFIAEGVSEGNIMVGLAYKRSTFSPVTKVLLGILLIGLYIAVIGQLNCTGKIKQLIMYISVFLILTAALSWNYMYNSMDNANIGPKNFEQDSENLVKDRVIAAKHGWIMADTQYGLGHFEVAYKSQYGLQGKALRHISSLFDESVVISFLHLICSLLTAATFVLIVFLLDKKYNRLMAGCFLITFWLSPWVVNYARNLYWVEFTWFIPMAVGLFCSMHIQSRSIRIGCYLLAFMAIAAKALCGYEFITTVMMGLIAFPTVDMLLAFSRKDRNQAHLLFRTTFILGIMALAGFAVAVLIHASLKGNGNITEGIHLIIQEDLLRRTNGGDLNNFPSAYWDSLNASIWETLCRYFHFSTQIITGIAGNLFPLLCIIPLAIFVFRFMRKELDLETVFMYIFFFLSSISWFCLAKSHSYVHTHMNFVMWYLGFVQICFYIIVNEVIIYFRKNKDGLSR